MTNAMIPNALRHQTAPQTVHTTPLIKRIYTIQWATVNTTFNEKKDNVSKNCTEHHATFF